MLRYESVASFASVTTVIGSVVESSSSDCEGSREAANSLLSKLRGETIWSHVKKEDQAKPVYACYINPKTVTPAAWAKAFQEEQIVVSAGKLFCSAC